MDGKLCQPKNRLELLLNREKVHKRVSVTPIKISKRQESYINISRVDYNKHSPSQSSLRSWEQPTGTQPKDETQLAYLPRPMKIVSQSWGF